MSTKQAMKSSKNFLSKWTLAVHEKLLIEVV